MEGGWERGREKGEEVEVEGWFYLWMGMWISLGWNGTVRDGRGKAVGIRWRGKKEEKEKKKDSHQPLPQTLPKLLHLLQIPRPNNLLLILTNQRQTSKLQQINPSILPAPLIPLLPDGLESASRGDGLEEFIRVGIKRLGRLHGIRRFTATVDPGLDAETGEVLRFGQEVHGVAGGGFDVGFDFEGVEARPDGGGDLGEEVQERGRGFEFQGVGVEDGEGVGVDLGF